MREDWGTMEWLVDDQNKPGLGLSLARMTVLPGQTSPAHRHPNCNEVIHVLTGSIKERRDSTWHTLNVGDTLVINAGQVHQTRALSDTPATLMVVYSDSTRIYEEVNQ